MGMTLRVNLHFMACLVCAFVNLSTASGVKHWNIVESWKFEYHCDIVTLLSATKYQVFFPLFVHWLTKAFIENPVLIFSQRWGQILLYY